MYTGLVHWNGNHFTIDGTPVRKPSDLPRSWDLRNHVYYMTSTFHSVGLAMISEYFISEGDIVFGESPGSWIGISIRLRNPETGAITGKYSILHPKIMNILEKDQKVPTILDHALQNKIARFFAYEIDHVTTSIAGTSVRLFSNEFNGEEYRKIKDDLKGRKGNIFLDIPEPENLSFEELLEELDDQGVNMKQEWRDSESRDTLLDNVFEEVFVPPLGSLPHRWREMAHAAVHGGPICCLRGGASMAAEVDIRGAYLSAMCGDIPIIANYEDPETGETSFNSYFAGRQGITWDEIMEEEIEHGFIDATVHVNENIKYGMPPLPVSAGEGMIFPRGQFRGVWTLPLLKMAVDFGEAKVLKIHNSFFTKRAEPIFLPYASYLKTLPKDISKELYVKFWGKFNFRGGWVGEKSVEPLERDCVPKNKLWWYEERIKQLDRARPTYRPDIAAYISSYNHINLYKAMRTLDPKSIIAVHVDAIWTDDIEGAERLCDNSPKVIEINIKTSKPESVSDYGGWVIKKRGPLRFWGCGIYDHNGKIGFSGFDPKVHSNGRTPTRKHIENWLKGNKDNAKTRENFACREWRKNITPGDSEHAVSKSLNLRIIDTNRPFGGMDFYGPDWLRSGWLRQDQADEPSQEEQVQLNSDPEPNNGE